MFFMIRNYPFKPQSMCLLHELIETVPANKILGYGGDFRNVAGAYGHAQMARAITAEVLAPKRRKPENSFSGFFTATEKICLDNLVMPADEIVLGFGDPPVEQSSMLRQHSSIRPDAPRLPRIDNREANGRIGANKWGKP
jgi:hypothetical protein